MPRKFFKRIIPKSDTVRSWRLHRVFGDRINDPSLWIINRSAVANAVAIGLGCAYIPVPVQMIPAALLAILFRANLPLAVALVWISNPLTWVIVFTPPYLLGAAILGETGISVSNITVEMLRQQFYALTLGSLIFGICISASGYVLTHLIWKLSIMNNWGKRRRRRLMRKRQRTQNPSNPDSTSK